MGGGVFELGNPEWRGAQAVLEIQVDVGVKKPCLPSWGCGFSGITQYRNKDQHRFENTWPLSSCITFD